MENNNLMSEQTVIGSLIQQPYLIDEIQCSENDFLDTTLRLLFKTIQSMNERAEHIDVLTLAEKLERMKSLDAIGGLSYLTDLVQNIPVTGNLRHFSKRLYDASIRRELSEVAATIAIKATNGTDDVDDLLSDAESSIFSVMDKRETSEPVKMGKAVDEAIEYLSNVIDGVTYQPTGLTDLDKMIGGLRGGATYVIAARSSMGKTALMCSIAHKVSKDKPCYIATLEMPRREIASRLMAIDGNLNIGDPASWNDEEFNRLTVAAHNIKNLNITIDHEEGLSLSKLRSRARRIKRRSGLGCIFVDYLQLMKAKADTREREVALISEGLKSLAKELDVPVVVLAQLNRDCDKRADKRPLMSDLRESGSIEQDADVIIMLYRDEVYDKDSIYKGVAELIVRKNRHGMIGDIFAQFNAESMHFRNKAQDWQAPTAPVKQSRGYYND